MGEMQEKRRHALQNKYDFLRAVGLSSGTGWFTILPEMLEIDARAKCLVEGGK